PVHDPVIDASTGASRRIDHWIVHWDAPGDGATWVRGAAYKARFDATGATYCPWLGSDAPHTIEIALSPDRVSVGGIDLAFERKASVAREGERVALDRGAFVEAYDVC